MSNSETLKFAEHFAKNHSYEAAQVIENLPTEASGEFLNAISDRASESVLAAMLPYHAAKCIEAMRSTPAARYLADITAQASSRILRQVSVETRQKLLAAMPRHKALHVSLILSYPQSLVGAWMDPAVFPLAAHESVKNARSKITDQHYSHGVIYAVDDNNCVRAAVSLIALLQCKNDDISLKSVSSDTAAPIFASTTVGKAIRPEIWGNHDILPVIDRERQLVGVVRYGDLRRATGTPPSKNFTSHDDRNLLGITESFCLGLAEMMKTTLEYQPGQRVAQDRVEKE